MYELEREHIDEIKGKFDHLVTSMKLEDKVARLATVEQLAAAPYLWNEPARARGLLQEQNALQLLVGVYRSLQQQITTMADFVVLAAQEKDASVAEDITRDMADLDRAYRHFEVARTLSGELDGNNAYLAIHAGAGGTEACDWAAMLLRMYLRWCERHELKAALIDALDGEGAGYKSATLYITGKFAYGYLKAERGVHRLVRISPFDSNKRRHTSFSSVDVTAEVNDDIEIEVHEKDLRIDTYRSSGACGQHVNVTDSAVRITHIPSGIVVACQNERSQIKNRSTAMKMLRAKLYQLEIEEREKKAAQSYESKQKIEWSSQIRSYVLHPYTMVKDLRTDVETSNAGAVLDGDLDEFIEAYLRATATAD